MKYLVIGAGGTGGTLSFHLAKAGHSVSIIARGMHGNAIRTNGLSLSKGKLQAENVTVPVYETEEYNDSPDIVFVCVKGYSIDGIIPFLKRICRKDTIVIPLLNITSTGAYLQNALPNVLVTDGCIYVTAEISSPGHIHMGSPILRVVFGVRNMNELRRELFLVKEDLAMAGIETILSDNIQRDAMQKFSFVSPMAAAGLYYDCSVGAMQVTGNERDFFFSLVKEIDSVANAMGLSFLYDILKINQALLDNLPPECKASLQKDIENGRMNEADGLIYEVVRLGKKYNVPTPCYKLVSDKLQLRLK